jgi:hypothetical protein
MGYRQAADAEDGFQILKVTVNILNKQSRTADKGWSSSLKFGRREYNLTVKSSILRNVTQCLVLVRRVLVKNGSVRECIQSLRTESITKYTLTTINTHWEATKSFMAAKFIRLAHKIAIQLHLMAESCIICSSRSKRPVRELLDIASYFLFRKKFGTYSITERLFTFKESFCFV